MNYNQNQLMKSSCYKKPRTAMPSKKNSNVSVLYKDVGDSLATDQRQTKNHKKITSKDYTYVKFSADNSKCKSRKNSKQNSKEIVVTSTHGLNSRESRNTIHMQLQNAIPITYGQKKLSPAASREKESIYTNYLRNDDKLISHNVSQSNLATKQENKMLNVLRNVNSNHNKTDKQIRTSRKNFEYKYIIGKGGFGKVWKVEHRKNRNQYAMKEMLKSLVMTKKSIQSVINEKVLLSGLNSPFLVNMHYAFQDRETLYLVLDILEGGDLRHHLSKKTFNETQSKFFICCIVLGLEYLHANHIIHRDIKPENIVLDSRGYIRITDLGIARVRKTNNNCDTSGTPGYMSPQVISRLNHSYTADYFALGVIAYQLACQRRPYNGMSRNEVRQKMLAKQVQIKRQQLPQDWSLEAADFINRLLMRKPQQRLGYCGIHQIKQHPWIRDVNWKKLMTKQIESPFIPLMRKSDFDQDQQITIEDEDEGELIEKNSVLLRKPEIQQLFKNYAFEPSHRATSKQSSNKLVNKSNKQGTENHPSLTNGLYSKLSLKTPHSSTRRMTNSNRPSDNERVYAGSDNVTNANPKFARGSHQQERPFFKM